MDASQGEEAAGEEDRVPVLVTPVEITEVTHDEIKARQEAALEAYSKIDWEKLKQDKKQWRPDARRGIDSKAHQLMNTPFRAEIDYPVSIVDRDGYWIASCSDEQTAAAIIERCNESITIDKLNTALRDLPPEKRDGQIKSLAAALCGEHETSGFNSWSPAAVEALIRKHITA
jgi:hypothetical protein